MAEQKPEQRSPLRAAVGLVLIVALLGGMWFVMQQLRHASAIQDCVASGRRDCVPISGR